MGEMRQRATGMSANRTRDENGRLRQKRADTRVGNIEREYDVDFKVRSDMELGTLRERTGLTSIDALVRKAREDQ
jgi:hypothetical protein